MASSTATNGLTAYIAPPPATIGFRLGQRPALDGVRAIAVLAVMAHHGYVPFFRGGSIGVDIFFVLSGFLITGLLLEEWEKTSGISFRKFYLRRALRLLPALVVLLLFVEVYSLVILRGPRLWEIQKAVLAVLFYVANWVSIMHPDRLGPLSHAWSLSIEEQFYLLWPPVLFLLLHYRLRIARIAAVIALITISVAVHRAFVWTGPASAWRIYNGLDTRIDELLAGCALAAALSAGCIRVDWLRILVRWSYQPAIALILYLVSRPLSPHIMYKFGWPIVEICLVVILYRLMGWENTILHRLLESPSLVWIGRLSYGLYLWHFPIFEKVGGWEYLRILKIPVAFALTFMVATLSFYFVERPFLRLKSQFKVA
jgi:peptidoglycan/LPS O-acetylase OafA/YrhL